MSTHASIYTHRCRVAIEDFLCSHILAGTRAPRAMPSSTEDHAIRQSSSFAPRYYAMQYLAASLMGLPVTEAKRAGENISTLVDTNRAAVRLVMIDASK